MTLCIIKPSSNRSFFKLCFLTKRKRYQNEFLLIYVHINGVHFQCFSWKKSFTSRFLVRNTKINFFEEKSAYCAAFIKLKCRRFHTGLVDLQNICKHFLKIAISEIFPRFLKIVPSTCKNHCMHFILPEKGRLNPTKLNQPIL